MKNILQLNLWSASPFYGSSGWACVAAFHLLLVASENNHSMCATFFCVLSIWAVLSKRRLYTCQYRVPTGYYSRLDTISLTAFDHYAFSRVCIYCLYIWFFNYSLRSQRTIECCVNMCADSKTELENIVVARGRHSRNGSMLVTDGRNLFRRRPFSALMVAWTLLIVWARRICEVDLGTDSGCHMHSRELFSVVFKHFFLCFVH